MKQGVKISIVICALAAGLAVVTGFLAKRRAV